MKKISSLMSTVIMMAVLTTVISLTSCKKESQPLNSDRIADPAALQSSNNISAEKSGAPLKVDGMQAYLRVTTVSGAIVDASTTGGTFLYTRPNGLPPTKLLAPDGHQLTLAEFRTVNGWVDVKCINMGTHAVLHMKGLIPNGIYTLWIFGFNSPGPATPGTFIGAGAFGAPDGSNNSFVADGEGTASISITLGDLSFLQGISGNCLSSVFESHIVAAYHPDQQTHGAGPGSIWVAQMFFPVVGSKL